MELSAYRGERHGGWLLRCGGVVGASARFFWSTFLLSTTEQWPGRGSNGSCMVVGVPVSCSDVRQTSRVMFGSTVVPCSASDAWFRMNFHFSS